MMNWVPEGTFDRGVIGGLTLGLAWFVLVCVGRSLAYICRFGLWSWLKSALKIEHGSLGLVLLLLILLLVTVLTFPPSRWP
jgi:hypothetical protein